MRSPRNPNPSHHPSSPLDLVRPAFVILHIVLLPVALLQGDPAGREPGERGASEVRHERERAETPRHHGHQA